MLWGAASYKLIAQRVCRLPSELAADVTYRSRMATEKPGRATVESR